MGRDKGLILEDGQTWAERAAQLLALVTARVVDSIHPRQVAAYSKALPHAQFVIDSPAYQNVGPLGGLLSVHAAFPDANLLLLACDMRAVRLKNLTPLVEGNCEIAAYYHDGLYEPLCAYYTFVALQKMADLFQLQKLPTSLQKILHSKILTVKPIEVESSEFLRSQNCYG